MFAEQRHELILREVRERGSVRLADLVERLGVSMVTLRRDVEHLAAQGLLKRVHGGVTRVRSDLTGPSGGALEPELLAEDSDTGGVSLVIGMLIPSATYYYPNVIRGPVTRRPSSAPAWCSASHATTRRRNGSRSTS